MSAAVALSRDGLDVPFFFNRKEAKDHGEGGVFVGYVPKAGEDVVIVEDVITAGTAIRESMAILSRLEGVRVAAAFIMVDRKERGLSLIHILCQSIGEPVIPAEISYSLEEAKEAAKRIGYPVVLRPAFTLGGTGGGFAYNEDELVEIGLNAFALSPVPVSYTHL